VESATRVRPTTLCERGGKERLRFTAAGARFRTGVGAGSGVGVVVDVVVVVVTDVVVVAFVVGSVVGSVSATKDLAAAPPASPETSKPPHISSTPRASVKILRWHLICGKSELSPSPATADGTSVSRKPRPVYGDSERPLKWPQI
jgi:hypothetical protein